MNAIFLNLNKLFNQLFLHLVVFFFLQALSFSSRLVKYYITNEISFTVHDVVSLVELGEWDNVDICLESPNDHELTALMILMIVLEVCYLLH